MDTGDRFEVALVSFEDVSLNLIMVTLGNSTTKLCFKFCVHLGARHAGEAFHDVSLSYRKAGLVQGQRMLSGSDQFAIDQDAVTIEDDEFETPIGWHRDIPL